MKKRILSGFLAALMLISYAVAAEDTITEQEEAVFASENVSSEIQQPVVISGEVLEADGSQTAEQDVPQADVLEEEPIAPAVPDQVAFPDIPGHWAEKDLLRAVELGVLKGIGGKMMPNNAVKRNESLTILNRVLGASVKDDISPMSQVAPGVWYYNDVAKAVHLGLIETTDKKNFDIATTRAEAFVFFARAFGYDNTAEATSISKFSDTASMTAEQKRAASALISAGVVKGSTSGKLNPSGGLTRAEFVTMLFRIVSDFPKEDIPVDTQIGTLFSQKTVEFEGSILSGDSVFSPVVESVSLVGTNAVGRFVLKGAETLSLDASSSSLSKLICDTAGSALITLDDESTLETLNISGTGGAVTYQGDAQQIEITAKNRMINLSGMTVQKLTIMGSGNTIIMNGNAAEVEILTSAKNTTLTVNNMIGRLKVSGIGTTVNGSGKANSVDVRAIDCNISIETDEKTEDIDRGLAGVSIKFGVPNKVVPGGTLLTQVTFQNVAENKICKAEWFQDGKAIKGYSSNSFALSPTTVSRHTSYFTFTKNMQKTVKMGFKLTYQNASTGQTEVVYNEVVVPIENHSDEWYYQRDVNRVLNLVSSTYRGNYTIKYATDNDYKAYEKEVFVNAKGYSSRSSYLVWINRAYQHVNVFTGSKGNWKLHKSFLVGTGASSSQTPTGITTVSYKSSAGWTTSTYTVKPVVGFYPGTGYAFHSRLYYPGTTTIQDYSIGYPISHGCIRMYDSDVQWIYNNIPVGTTVVIF